MSAGRVFGSLQGAVGLVTGDGLMVELGVWRLGFVFEQFPPSFAYLMIGDKNGLCPGQCFALACELASIVPMQSRKKRRSSPVSVLTISKSSSFPVCDDKPRFLKSLRLLALFTVQADGEAVRSTCPIWLISTLASIPHIPTYDGEIPWERDHGNSPRYTMLGRHDG